MLRKDSDCGQVLAAARLTRAILGGLIRTCMELKYNLHVRVGFQAMQTILCKQIGPQFQP